MNWQKIQKYISILLVVMSIIFIVALYNKGNSVSLEDMQEKILGYGIWSPIIFLCIYVFITTFSPSSPFMAIAGVIFGFKYGMLYSAIGNLLSAVIMFYVSRALGKKLVDKILKHKYMRHIERYNSRLENSGLLDLILLRIAPIMPFNILNIIMGVSKIKIKVYVVGTIIGLLPSTFIAVYFGELISKIF